MPIEDLTAVSIEKELRAACLEMEHRLRGGEECSAEQLLARYPKLGDDPDSALELIFAEFVLRRQRGEQISPEQWYERFPQWRERLERLLHVYEIMGAEASLATGVMGDTVRAEDSLSTPRSPAHEDRRIGSYELLEEIARGGMGVVYKARHSGLKRVVALKLILAGEHAGAEQRARFRQEAEAAARLQHPNIVQIFEVGQEGNLPFLAMEYVDGPPLNQYLSRRRSEGTVGLPARQAAELVECLARAMHHAHQQGVVHRDLKPANVLLQGRGSRVEGRGPENSGPSAESGSRLSTLDPRPILDLRPKITDFGLAKILNESQIETRADLLLGTPSYMAPEQAAGRTADIGPATDVFALGVILYELLTGYLPFQGTSVEETLQQVRWVEPIPPSQLQRSVPRDLQTICLKCLQKEPTRRYGSAEALADDLRRLLRDEPILARPVGRIERAWRWCRRNKAVATLAGGIALLLVSGITVATSLAVWALNEKGRATASARQARDSAGQEREARALADHRFAQAEKAVEDYLDGIENNERLKEADFLDLRKQLLTSAVPFYEDFVKQKPSDARLKFKRGKAHLRLGTLHDELGEHEQALGDFNQMQDIFQELVSDFPKEPEYRRELATGHNNLGVLLRKLGKQEAAEVQYRSALAIFEQLTADFSNDPGYRNDLARTHGNLANLLGRTVGGRDEAAEHHVQAITLRKQLAEEFPTLPEYREGLASAHLNFGGFFQDGRKRPEAEAEYRQAFFLHERLAAEFPSDPRYRLSLAMSQRTMGDMQARLKKPEEAQAYYHQAISGQQSLATEFPTLHKYRDKLADTHFSYAILLDGMAKPELAKAEYREALQIRTQLVEQFPEVTDYQCYAARVSNNLAVILGKEGDLEEARRLFVKAVEHQKKAFQTSPKNPVYAESLRSHYHGLADITLKQKDHVATAEAADRLAEFRPDVADDAQLAARFYGHCVVLAKQDSKYPKVIRQVLAHSYANRSMAYLHEAVRRGFVDVKRFKTVAALAPLYDRSDFQRLVQLYRVDGAQEGEELKVIRVTEGTAEVQWMVSFRTGRWSGDHQLYWRHARPGARLELALPVNVTGTYDLEIVMTKASDYAVTQLWLNDAKLGDPVDLFHANGVVPTEVLKHSGLSLTAGRHVLSFEILGANPAAYNGYMVGLDYVRLIPSSQAGQ